ncbi:MAG: MFS transporter, partial [Actinomycetota bacterium]
SLAPLRAALQALLTQNVVLLGTFFVVPLYLQLVQGLNALETGLRMLPVSVAMLLTSLGGSLLSSRLSPRAIVRGGFAVLVVALATLIGAIEPALEGWGFGSAMAALGVGMGLIASQLGNVIQSAVDDGDRSEAGGLQWTAQQLGGSLGVAVIGAVVLSALAGNVIAIVEDDARLAPQVREQVTTQVSEGLDFVTVEQVGDAGQEAGLDAASLAAVTEDYAEAQLVALKAGLLAALGLAVLALVLVRDLPSGKARPPVPTS